MPLDVLHSAIQPGEVQEVVQSSSPSLQPSVAGEWYIWDSGEWWMLLAAQSMAVGTVMVRWVSQLSDPIMATGWVRISVCTLFDVVLHLFYARCLTVRLRYLYPQIMLSSFWWEKRAQFVGKSE